MRASSTALTMKRYFIPTLLWSILILQGCSEPLGVRDAIRDRLVSDGDHPTLIISDNGAVLARGQIEQIAEKSFDLAGSTFTVTAKTDFLDASGSVVELGSFEIGQSIEVDARQLDGGDFEATFVEEVDDGDDPDEDGEEGDEVKVEICHVPPGNPENARTKSVEEGSVDAHLEHGDTEGACPASVDEGDEDDGEEGEEGEDEEEDGEEDEDAETAAVCHIPPGNPDNFRTLWVETDDVEDHLDHGDYEGECGEAPPDSGEEGSDDPDGDDDEVEETKVEVCHIPPGNPDNARTLNIDESDLQDHLDHGDLEGPCGEEPPDQGGVDGSDDPDEDGDDPDEGDDDEPKVLVCHVPRGNPDNARTLEIGESDLQDHLDHGDTEGACPE